MVETDTLYVIEQAQEAEDLEEKFALQGVGVLDELKKAMQSPRISRTLLIKSYGLINLGNSLARANKNISAHIDFLSNALPVRFGDLLRLKGQINQKTTVLLNIVHTGGYLPACIKKKDYAGALNQISIAETALSELVALINKLKTEFKVAKKKYASFKDKIIDLLKGAGDYAIKSQEERRKLWNHWVETVGPQRITDIDLTGADLQYFNFNSFVFDGKIIFKNANLSFAEFRRATLNGANFQGATLEETDFLLAHLNGAIFKGANMPRVGLPSSQLVDAHLENAYMAHANLYHANLQNAHLSGADLTDANMEDADLSDADLRADLKDIRHLTADQVKKSLNWEQSINKPNRLAKELGIIK